MDDDDEGGRYAEPALFDYVRVAPDRPRPHQAHPHTGRTHPPLACPAPRISEPLRGYRCPACMRRVHHEASAWDAHEAADRALAALGAAIVAAVRLLRDMPRWAEVGVGLALTVAPLLGWAAAQGWIPA